MECGLCKDVKTIYIGETSRNLYTRMTEHNSNRDDSFIQKHLDEYHPGQEAHFIPRVVKTNRDSMSRQIREGVQIRRLNANHRLMNTKSEWHQPSLYSICSEVVRE